MIDLTNKSITEIESFINKFSYVLSVVDQEKVPYIAIILNVAYPYVRDKYPELNTDWKTWSIVAVKELYDLINNENDIINLIDEFVWYYKKEYDNYKNQVSNNLSEYEINNNFTNIFINKKRGL